LINTLQDTADAVCLALIGPVATLSAASRMVSPRRLYSCARPVSAAVEQRVALRYFQGNDVSLRSGEI
jgi:hypothetical protein